MMNLAPVYSKLIGAFLGNLAGLISGLLISFLVQKGLGHCTDVNLVETCTVFGLSSSQVTAYITAAMLAVGNMIGVHQAPPNAPVEAPKP
jgi:hypothetical protein